MKAKSLTVRLNTYAGGQVFVGRKEVKGKKCKIVSVAEFERKMIYVRKAVEEGCPFARKAVIKIDNRIDSVRRMIISRINALDGKVYNDAAEKRRLTEEFRVITVECKYYDKTTVKFINLIVHYDEMYIKLVIDELKQSGKVRKYQSKCNLYRKKMRRIMSLAIAYNDNGYRGVLKDKHKTNERYKQMVVLYGEPAGEMIESHVGC